MRALALALLVLLAASLLATVQPEAQVEPRGKVLRAERRGLAIGARCLADLEILAGERGVGRLRVYVEGRGRTNLLPRYCSQDLIVYESNDRRARVVFTRVGESRYKFTAVVNATDDDRRLVVEVVGNGAVRRAFTSRLILHQDDGLGMVVDFSDAPGSYVDGTKLVVPLVRGRNEVDPYVEVYQYVRLTPPEPLQPGDVLAPHLYDWHFSVEGSRILASIQPMSARGMYAWAVRYRPTVLTSPPSRAVLAFRETTEIWQFAFHAHNNIYVVRRSDGGTTNYYLGVSPSISWFDVTYVLSSTTVLCYRDGALIRTHARVLESDDTFVGVNVGAESSGGTGPFLGHISYVLLYSAEPNVQGIYARVVNASGLRLFLDATFFNGTRYLDLSGYGNHGTPYSGVSRVPASQVWLWLVRGLHSDGLVRLRFFPNTSVVVFRNGTAMPLSGYPANQVGMVETATLSYSDASNIDYILVPAPSDILYTGYPANPEEVYAGIDTTFGVVVRHVQNASRVSLVKMKVGDVTFAWSRNQGFYEESDPRGVARLDAQESYVVYHNTTHVSVYFRFRLHYAFDTAEGHAWHDATFEAFADGGHYTLMPVQEAFRFADTLTAVDLQAPTVVSVGSYMTIRGRMVFTGTDTTPADYYGVHVKVYNGTRLLASLDPSVDPSTGEFSVRLYVPRAGTYYLRIALEAPDGEEGENNYVSVQARPWAPPQYTYTLPTDLREGVSIVTGFGYALLAATAAFAALAVVFRVLTRGLR